jgi:hypothetical protein
MGDKSPKSKERDQKQKSSAKAGADAAARNKQAGQSHLTPVPRRGDQRGGK